LRQASLLLAFVLFTGCGVHQRNLNRDDLHHRCLLLTTNDSESHLDGPRVGTPLRFHYQGTLDRIAAEKRRQLRQRPQGVLLVSAGDVLQGRYMARKDRDRRQAARRAWRLYEQAGYDVGVLGNHEFDAGPAVLRYALSGLKTFQIVTSNLDPHSPTLHNPKERLYKTLWTRRCGGLKLGFFGLLTPTTRNISDFGDTRFSDPQEPVLAPARRAVAALRAQRVDVIVALTHLGLRADLRLARAVSGIDLIIGGHSHTLLRKWKIAGQSVVVQSGERFGHLGYLDIKGRPGGGIIRAASSWRVRPIDEHMSPDERMKTIVSRFRADYAVEQIVGHRTKAWNLKGRERRRYGRLVAQAAMKWMRTQSGLSDKVAGAVLNMGGLRTNSIYPAGPVTDLEIRSIHPFRNRPVYLDVSGAELKEMLEHACTKGHRGHLGSRAILAGIDMRCNGERPRVRYRKSKGQVVGIAQRGQRVQRLEVAGKKIDPEGRYGIVTNDYIARGGSGYWWVTQLRRRCADGEDFQRRRCRHLPTLADVVEEAVRAGTFGEP